MISSKEFIERRNNLIKLLPEKNNLILIFGRDYIKRIPTVPFPFHQTSDLIYLSGYDKPNGILAIFKKNNIEKSILFLPEPNLEIEIWEGFRMKFKEAQKLSGVDLVLPLNEFKNCL